MPATKPANHRNGCNPVAGAARSYGAIGLN